MRKIQVWSGLINIPTCVNWRPRPPPRQFPPPQDSPAWDPAGAPLNPQGPQHLAKDPQLMTALGHLGHSGVRPGGSPVVWNAVREAWVTTRSKPGPGWNGRVPGPRLRWMPKISKSELVELLLIWGIFPYISSPIFPICFLIFFHLPPFSLPPVPPLFAITY